MDQCLTSMFFQDDNMDPSIIGVLAVCFNFTIYFPICLFTSFYLKFQSTRQRNIPRPLNIIGLPVVLGNNSLDYEEAFKRSTVILFSGSVLILSLVLFFNKFEYTNGLNYLWTILIISLYYYTCEIIKEDVMTRTIIVVVLIFYTSLLTKDIIIVYKTILITELILAILIHLKWILRLMIKFVDTRSDTYIIPMLYLLSSFVFIMIHHIKRLNSFCEFPMCE
jgi:hypothetical protein